LLGICDSDLEGWEMGTMMFVEEGVLYVVWFYILVSGFDG
jgi:hypothetical protein